MVSARSTLRFPPPVVHLQVLRPKPGQGTCPEEREASSQPAHSSAMSETFCSELIQRVIKHWSSLRHASHTQMLGWRQAAAHTAVRQGIQSEEGRACLGGPTIENSCPERTQPVA